MVERKKGSNKIDDERCYIDDYHKVPWGYNPSPLFIQRQISISEEETYSKVPRNKYMTNKANFRHIGDIWSLVIMDCSDYGPQNNRSYRKVLIVIDIFRFG